ncbi:YitT family ABC transporter [Mesoplasma corruscae]|uniref:YitT family protein n=1 Tax=Mesoplasma corruscae TaxID=216874 RepID=A0A2S5RGQ3_9MOLU|nr:YitT family ABC transporter [Mesoplasma corruscae]PPE06402.1 hypothetical protein MCORR_v1c00300 [Mesoplasma corruscae]
MTKKRRVKIYSYNGKKLLSLTEQEIHEIKTDERFDKIHENEFFKAKHRYEVKHYYSSLFWRDLLWIVLAAMLTTIAVDFFISVTGGAGLFPGGFGAIARFFSILINNTLKIPSSTTYFLIYFMINVPLAIFGYFKIGGRFAISTIIYLVLTIIFDLIIQNTPYINPHNLPLLIPIGTLFKTSTMGSMVLWLFVFAVFAGIINGIAYSMTYRAGASTGGSDWVSYYYSVKKDKSIGMINVRINICTLITIIILNTLIMQTKDIEASFKMNQIYYQFKDFESLKNTNFWHEVLNIAQKNDDKYKDIAVINPQNFKDKWLKATEIIARNHDFDDAYSKSMINWLKFKFIFGPSLFSSLILIIVQGITVDKSYPKNKVMNVMISTSKNQEVQQYLYNIGYNNNVFVWQTKTSKKNVFSDQEQDLLMISLPLLYWRRIEQHLLNIDEDMILNITGTQSVKGKHFSYKLDNETRDRALSEEMVANLKIMKKIENESIIKTYNKIQKANKYKNNV